MFKVLLGKFKESLFSLLPIILIVLLLCVTTFVKLETKELIAFIISSIFLIIGMGLFNLGADIAMTPMGTQVGTALTRTRRIGILLITCFVLGVLITIAEPDLSVLATQVEKVMNQKWILILTVGLGVGLFIVCAILKIIYKKDLSSMLMFFYLGLFAMAAILFASGKGAFIPLAFDSGGVTTGPITVPFIMALGVGIALTIGGRDANNNSFGLIALCSIGPMLAVMILALSFEGDIVYELADYSIEAGLGSNFFPTLLGKMWEVFKALGLIVLFFIILDLLILKLPKKRLIQIFVGILFTYVGLVIFLTAVSIGFMPIGFKIGTELSSKGKAIIIIVAFIIGMVTVLGEPAVYVLNKQVEEITGGMVTKKSMIIALSIGVGIAICLSVIRVLFDFSLLYYVVPGYLISLGLSFFVPKIYTAIAFDSGGVASGPLTSSFILPLVIGVCYSVMGLDKVMDLAFGVVAMVAMTPLITIQILGFRAITSEKVREKIIMKRILTADDEQIIYFN